MFQSKTNEKIAVQRIIVTVSILLLISKVIAYQLTNSIGILTDALESIVNVVAGVISLYSITVALKPKDMDHPFGHGKVEFLSASLEGFLIALAGLLMAYEAIYRLFVPSGIKQLDVGIVIIGAAGLVNYILGLWSIRVGEKNKSIALIAGGKHLKSDTYSTIGLVLGLTLLYFTGYIWLDSAIAITFGGILIITGVKILKVTTSNLMDEADFIVFDKIIAILNANRSHNWVDLSNMKMVKYGASYHIDCDLMLPWYFTIAEAKIETEELIHVLNAELPEEIDLTTHTLPCAPKFCTQCPKTDCTHREHELIAIKPWTRDAMTNAEK